LADFQKKHKTTDKVNDGMLTKLPPFTWRRREIKYADLKKVHPTTHGMHLDSAGNLISLQMTYPNELAYDDGWKDNCFYYRPSRGDDKGNRALKSAALRKTSFKLYCGYKRDKESIGKLKAMKLDKFAGQSFDLGKVMITGKGTDESYIIAQCT
jgi:hypothetical protein